MGGKLMLGDRVKYTINGHEWIGTVVAIRSSGTTIWSPYNNMERPGIQFQLRSHDGATIWTITYPDVNLALFEEAME